VANHFKSFGRVVKVDRFTITAIDLCSCLGVDNLPIKIRMGRLSTPKQLQRSIAVIVNLSTLTTLPKLLK